MANTRRSLLASLPAVALGATVATPAVAAVAQPNPDAELIALCAEYVALDRAFIQNGLQTADMLSDNPRYEPLRDASSAMVPRLNELEDLIADIEPRTREGLLAKAEVARRSLVDDGDDPEGGELMNSENYLACTVIENLLDLIGGQA